MTPLQIPSATLANGVTMPRLVFGTYQIKDPKICQKAVEDALEAGYRAIDTAQSYGNEAAVGAALKACGLPRSELFITTKLWVEDASEAGARRAALRSMELLGLDYLDLYLIHQPVGDVFGAWRTIEALYREDLLRAVGVSNFSPDRLMDMALSSTIRPQVNQIEINPFCQQKDALPVMASLGILPEAWAPFAEGRNGRARRHCCQTQRIHCSNRSGDDSQNGGRRRQQVGKPRADTREYSCGGGAARPNRYDCNGRA